MLPYPTLWPADRWFPSTIGICFTWIFHWTLHLLQFTIIKGVYIHNTVITVSLWLILSWPHKWTVKSGENTVQNVSVILRCKPKAVHAFDNVYLYSLQYVLSVLKFTYPTIFQGWQTLVGGILLRVLLSNKCLSVSTTELDKPGFISLLPSFLFFSAGIVASSKALANLVSIIAFLMCMY